MCGSAQLLLLLLIPGPALAVQRPATPTQVQPSTPVETEQQAVQVDVDVNVQQQQQVIEQLQGENDDEIADLDVDLNADNNDLDDQVFIDNTDTDLDMADDKFMPPIFHGRSDESGDEWLRHFQHFCLYKAFDGDKSLALMKVLLKGNAANWFDSLTATQTASFDALVTAFKTRYKPPDTMKFKSAKELYSHKQREDESAEDFIESMRKLGREIKEGPEGDEMSKYAILNGLRPNIATFVTQREPENLDDLVKSARLAELTYQDPLAQVKDEIRQLSAKWDKMSIAPVGDRPISQNRSPSPSSKRVTFEDQRGTTPHALRAPRVTMIKGRIMNRGSSSVILVVDLSVEIDSAVVVWLAHRGVAAVAAVCLRMVQGTVQGTETDTRHSNQYKHMERRITVQCITALTWYHKRCKCAPNVVARHMKTCYSALLTREIARFVISPDILPEFAGWRLEVGTRQAQLTEGAGLTFTDGHQRLLVIGVRLVRV